MLGRSHCVSNGGLALAGRLRPGGASLAAGDPVDADTYVAIETDSHIIRTGFVKDAADGFNIMPPYLPGGLDEFVELVVPILRQRGLFRSEYEGTTLRENLGLPRPVNQFSAVPSSASA